MSSTAKLKTSGSPKPEKQSPSTPLPLDWKLEAARALGLLDKVEQVGWGGLTAAESGRIGGWMTKMKREAGVSSSPAEPIH